MIRQQAFLRCLPDNLSFTEKISLFRRLGWHPAKRHAVIIFLPADPVEAVFLGRVLRELGKDRKQGILHA